MSDEPRSEADLLRIFPLRWDAPCLYCMLDYPWQAMGLGGGRCSFFCSDTCKALSYRDGKKDGSSETDGWPRQW